jgi:hypothetical protein
MGASGVIPTAKLGVQVNQTKPPKPTGVGVIVGGKVIAVITLDEVRRILCHVDHLEVAYEHRKQKEEE